MANLPTPALRKKRILRDVCLLLLCPLVLLLAGRFKRQTFLRAAALSPGRLPRKTVIPPMPSSGGTAGTPWEPCGGRGPSGSPSGSTQFSRTTRSP